MTDKLTPERRSANMSAIRSKDMKPELLVRKLVHSMGFRYRLHKKDLPGRPDLAFPGRHKVIFVHGCFWHQHSARSCKIARVPKSNVNYWKPKLERNKARDRRHQRALKADGWDVLVVWECQLKKEGLLRKRLQKFLA